MAPLIMLLLKQCWGIGPENVLPKAFLSSVESGELRARNVLKVFPPHEALSHMVGRLHKDEEAILS